MSEQAIHRRRRSPSWVPISSAKDRCGTTAAASWFVSTSPAGWCTDGTRRPTQSTSFVTEGDVGAVVLCEDGGLMPGHRVRVVAARPAGEMTLIADVEAKPGVRFNDCRADPRGRLWAGTLHRDREPRQAALYRLDPGGELTTVLPERTISNGIGWSPGGTTMYYIDSTTQRVVEFDYDLDTGELGEQRMFAEIDPTDGLPDGLTVDADGGVWVCLFGGGRIRRYLIRRHAGSRDHASVDQPDMPGVRRR